MSDIEGLAEMLDRDMRKMRAAGGALAVAAVHVIHEYDGLHRLSLAVAEWQKVIASEGDRDIRHATPTPEIAHLVERSEGV